METGHAPNTLSTNDTVITSYLMSYDLKKINIIVYIMIMWMCNDPLLIQVLLTDQYYTVTRKGIESTLLTNGGLWTSCSPLQKIQQSSTHLSLFLIYE